MYLMPRRETVCIGSVSLWNELPRSVEEAAFPGEAVVLVPQSAGLYFIVPSAQIKGSISDQ